MCGSRWVATPLWWSMWLRFFFFCIVCLFLQNFKNPFCLPFLGPYYFCALYAHPCMKYSLGISNFLEEISSLSILLFSSTSLHCSWKKTFVLFFHFLWNSAFSWIYLSGSPLLFASLLSSAVCKASSDNHFAFLHFFLFCMVLVTDSYTVLYTSIHRSQELCLPDLIFWINSSPPVYNHKGFDLDHTWIA